MRAIVYLTFAGNAREAMLFYKKCIGGKLQLQTIGNSPLSKKMPAKMRNCILHSSLIKKEFAIMASDMVSENGLAKGNSMSIMLNCRNERELKDIYKKLSRGGKQTRTIETTFFGSLLGDLVDKYGNTWLLHCELKESKSKQYQILENYEYDIPF